MTKDELNQALTELGWSTADTARELHCSTRAVRYWRRGDRKISGPAEAYISREVAAKRACRGDFIVVFEGASTHLSTHAYDYVMPAFQRLESLIIHPRFTQWDETGYVVQKIELLTEREGTAKAVRKILEKARCVK